MTGPEHYREAERLADLSLKTPYSDQRAALAAVAQVHATLALAAAYRDGAIPRGQVLADRCRTAESAYGRQCFKVEGHAGEHAYEGDEDHIDDVVSASELYEMDQADEAALDAAAEGGESR